MRSFRTLDISQLLKLPTPLAGRSEFRVFLLLYFLSLPFQLLTTGAVLQQGSTALVVLTAMHAGIVAALFWTLLGNAIVSTQVVEDGTLSSLIVRFSPSFICASHITFVPCIQSLTDAALPGTASPCASSPSLSSELQPTSPWT